MVHIDCTSAIPPATGASLTAPLAISLAETAYKAGRLERAARYLEIAYAIFDAQQAMAEMELNVSPKGD